MTQLTKEERIQAALASFREGKTEGVRQAARLFGINHTTLHYRLKGCRPHAVAHTESQRLTPAEEVAVVKAVQQMVIWGWPLTINALETLTTSLLVKKGDLQPLGHLWYQRFLSRHPEIKTTKSRATDQSRKDAGSFDVLCRWFDLFNSTKAMYGIPDDDTYNMDEKGVMKGIGDNSKVIVNRYDKEVTSAQPGNREWVSIIECIGGSGFVLPPFVIFEGKTIQRSWTPEGLDPKIKIRVSEKGWTDHEIALEWLQHFDALTKSQTKGTHRLLVFDGHSSHCTMDFVAYCEANNIMPICLPPHSTHILQPLDVGIFSALSKAYKVLVSRKSLFGAVRIDNRTFLEVYSEARLGIPKNVASAWRCAGLIPFCPEKVTSLFRPVTPPFVSLVDSQGRKIDMEVNQTTEQRFSQLIDRVNSFCTPRTRLQLDDAQNEVLGAFADRACLQTLNDELVAKQRNARMNRERKAFGGARVLSLGEMQKQKAVAEAWELGEAATKAARAERRGISAFAKVTWKEVPVDDDVFRYEVILKTLGQRKARRTAFHGWGVFIKAVWKDLPVSFDIFT